MYFTNREEYNDIITIITANTPCFSYGDTAVVWGNVSQHLNFFLVCYIKKI